MFFIELVNCIVHLNKNKSESPRELKVLVTMEKRALARESS